MADKPDCAVCGLPYHRHNIGNHVLCPIIATYRPKPPEAADEITRLNALVDEMREGLEPFARGDHGIEDIRRARALICRVKGVKAATVPSVKVPRQTHG